MGNESCGPERRCKPQEDEHIHETVFECSYPECKNHHSGDDSKAVICQECGYNGKRKGQWLCKMCNLTVNFSETDVNSIDVTEESKFEHVVSIRVSESGEAEYIGSPDQDFFAKIHQAEEQNKLKKSLAEHHKEKKRSLEAQSSVNSDQQPVPSDSIWDGNQDDINSGLEYCKVEKIEGEESKFLLKHRSEEVKDQIVSLTVIREAGKDVPQWDSLPNALSYWINQQFSNRDQVRRPLNCIRIVIQQIKEVSQGMRPRQEAEQYLRNTAVDVFRQESPGLYYAVDKEIYVT